MSRRAIVGLALLASLFLGAGAGSEVRETASAEDARAVHRDVVPAGPSVATRVEEIRLRIQDALVYPPSARARGLEGVARVRFAIRRDGRAEGIEVAASSGYGLLDRAAERSVLDAAPLPWVYGRLEVPVRFALEAGR